MVLSYLHMETSVKRSPLYKSNHSVMLIICTSWTSTLLDWEFLLRIHLTRTKAPISWSSKMWVWISHFARFREQLMTCILCLNLTVFVFQHLYMKWQFCLVLWIRWWTLYKHLNHSASLSKQLLQKCIESLKVSGLRAITEKSCSRKRKSFNQKAFFLLF